jgi:hypothetical protein
MLEDSDDGVYHSGLLWYWTSSIFRYYEKHTVSETGCVSVKDFEAFILLNVLELTSISESSSDWGEFIIMRPNGVDVPHPLTWGRIWSWVAPKAGLDNTEKEKFLTLRGFEFLLLRRPPRGQSPHRLLYRCSQDMPLV